MRHIATFVSVVALIWAVCATLKVPGHDLTWPIPLNVMAQCFFALLALWGLQKTAIQSPTYLLFFNLGFMAVMVTALICAGRFTAAFPFEIAAPLIAICVLFALWMFRSAIWRMALLHKGAIPLKEIPVVVFASVLLLCGLLSVASLIAESRYPLKVSAIALGGFWLLLAVFFFAYAIGNIHLHTTTQKFNHFVPSMLAIVAFGWLAFQLSGLQAEASREQVPQQTLEATHATE